MTSARTIFSSLWLFGLLESSAAVVFGQTATTEDFAFTVSLQWEERHKCGGTLISPDTVLTVAHCYSLVWVRPKDNKLVSVLLGTAYQRSEPGDPKEPFKTRAYVRQVIFAPGIPEKFKTFEGMTSMTSLSDVPNDYMILKLDRNITSLRVTPIRDCYGSNLPQPGDKCVIGGWGRYRYPDSKNPYANTFPRQLQIGKVKVYSVDEVPACKDAPPTMMCTKQIIEEGYPKGGPCFGDSGSPLMCQDSCNAQYLAGLVETDLMYKSLGFTAKPPERYWGALADTNPAPVRHQCVIKTDIQFFAAFSCYHTNARHLSLIR